RAVLGASIGLALVFGLTSRPSSSHLHWNLKTTFAWLTWVWESIFGIDAVGSAKLKGALSLADFEGSATGNAGLSAMPLTLTFITLLVAAISFRRAIKQTANALSALLMAIGAAIATSAVLLVVSLAVSIDTADINHLMHAGPGGSQLGKAARGWQNLKADVSASFTMSSLQAALISSSLLLAVFVAAILMRTDWLPPRIGRAVDACAVPALRGFSRLIGAVVASGLLVELITWVVRRETHWPPGEHNPAMTFHQWVTAFSGAIAYAGNVGVMSLGLGSFGKVGYRWGADVSFDGYGISWPQTQHHYGLASLAQSNHLAWGIWISAVCTPLVLGYVAWSIARRQVVRPRTIAVGLTSWVLSLIVVMPLLAIVANLSINGSLDAYGSISGQSGPASVHGSAAAGLETWPAALLILCYAAILSLLIFVAFTRTRGRTTDIPAASPSL
ncbi:MAG TPA: hypothetical protein VN108_10000, partial [Marmoricola sp.]|nr:hypothetical protein [Marmoricola sp.]